MIAILPTVLSSNIFGCWVDIKSLIRLDSAYCNHVDRVAFASLLSSKEFIFHCPVSFDASKLIAWLSARKVKVSSIRLGTASELLPDYLRNWGSFIKSVDIGSEEMSHVVLLMAIHCKNLQVVRCTPFHLVPAFKELLWCNPNISEIWLSHAHGSYTTLFENVPLNKLSTLSISRSLLNIRFSLPITSLNNTLQKLQLDNSADAELILKTVRLTPVLKSLSLKDVQLTDETLTQICSILPTLLHLDVSNNQMLSGNGVLAMCKSLTKLRSINLQKCSKVLDRDMRSLATYCGDTLEVVYMDVKDPNDKRIIDYLECFSRRCVKLHTLCIFCRQSVLCLAGGTFALLQGLPALRLLIVEAEKVICVSSRRFLHVTHPKLRIVVGGGRLYTYNALLMAI